MYERIEVLIDEIRAIYLRRDATGQAVLDLHEIQDCHGVPAFEPGEPILARGLQFRFNRQIKA